jgi:hypothetical protein
MRGTINRQSKDSYRIMVSIGRDSIGKYIDRCLNICNAEISGRL